MITFEEATVEHGRYLAKNLRSEEMDEVWTLNGDPFEAIKYSVERSVETWTLLEDGEIMSMFGVKPDYVMSSNAKPWLLSVERSHKHPRELIKATKFFLNKWKPDYALLYNYVDNRYTDSLNWAKWAGFDILPPTPMGRHGLLFNKIEIRRK